MKLRTMDLLPPNTRVKLREEMRRRVFSDKVSLMEKLNISRNTVNNWLRGDLRPSVEQLRLLGVRIEELWDEVEFFTLEGSKHKFKLPKEIVAEKILWLIGINESDGVSIKKCVGVTNQEKLLIHKFISEIQNFGVNKEELKMHIHVNNKENIDKQNISKEFGISLENIKVFEVKEKTNNPIFKIFLSSKIFINIFFKIKEMLQQIASNELTEFVEGFADGEGCVTSRKSIEIGQLNSIEGISRMFIIDKVLTDLGVLHSFRGPNCKNILTIRIFGGKRNIENLKRFNNLIGFSHPEKQDKLNQIINNEIDFH